MMFSRKYLAAVGAILAVMANGSPVEVAERELQERSLGNIYFCANDEWMPPCELFGVDSNMCYNVPDDFNDKINAFGPDQGIGCILYENYDCSGSSVFVAYPGDSQLDGVNFGNTTSSFECFSFN